MELHTLNIRLKTLAIFRNLLDTEVVSNLIKFINSVEKGSLDEQVSAYGAFCKTIYENGGNLTDIITGLCLDDENLYLTGIMHKKEISQNIKNAFPEEIKTIAALGALTSEDLRSCMDFDGYLPIWENKEFDLAKKYEEMTSALDTKGHGIFSKYRAFRVVDSKIVPVKSPDPQTADKLYGYVNERKQVFENTRALAEGMQACNVFLYGDAGTGKSSTIKACANAFYDKGVRLVEFTKFQLSEIPDVIEQLHDNPLKFIFYIDDLSFEHDDDSFTALKGILEGNIISYSKNIVIYATSNRRHLIKESKQARMGSDIHLNDTLQQTMSLSARFGLTITFSKPEKDLYLEIVKSLAEEYGVELEDADLFRRAEAFAIRSNGRSPRTAKQFIQLVKIGIK